jgi:F-type H+-transporting ATPase subunit delta
VISVTLARRYARALLELAKKETKLEETHADLRSFADAFAREPRARRFFESPSISRAEKIAFLSERLRPSLSRPVYALLHVLLRRRRLDHLIAIAAEFEKLAEQAEGLMRATIKTAVPIRENQAQALTRALAQRTGRKVLLTREVDPALLGGALVSLDHKIFDGTLATELTRIRRRLRQARLHTRG